MHFLLSDPFSFRSVPFKGSLHVRPDTLWSYVLTPSRRTCKHPLDVRPQSQGRTSKGFLAEEFDVLCLSGAISSLSEKRVFSGCGQPRWVLSHSQGVSECQNESKIRKSVAKTQKGAQILQGSLTRVLSRCAKLFLVGSIKIVMHTYLYYGAVSHCTSYSSASFGIRQTHLYIIGKSTFTIRSVVLSFITNISMYMGRYFILPTTLRLAAEKT